MSIFLKEFDGFPSFGELKSDLTIPVAVVGGGIAGLLTAYHLTQKGVKVALFEARKIAHGTTARTTAAVTALQGLFYGRHDPKTAKAYFESQIDGLKSIKDIIDTHSIDCDFETAPAYLYASKKADRNKLKKEYNALKSMGAAVSQETLTYFPVPAIRLEGQGQFDPLKFLAGLPKEFDIYENTRITDVNLDQKTLKTEGGNTVKADKIVIATRFPIIYDGAYYLKMYQTKSYVVAFRHEKLGATYNSTGDSTFYFRSVGDIMLLGGGDHRSGKHKKNTDYFKVLNFAAKNTFGAKEGDFVDKWSAIDSVTFDSVPFAGQADKTHPDAFVITGFNEWGMTNAAVTSKTVADIITNGEAKYQGLFSPQRPYYFKNLGKFLRQGGTAAVNLFLGLFKGKQSCRHLHCKLNYNRLEGVYECPCHGSRYDKDGTLLDGPAVKSIEND